MIFRLAGFTTSSGSELDSFLATGFGCFCQEKISSPPAMQSALIPRPYAGGSWGRPHSSKLRDACGAVCSDLSRPDLLNPGGPAVGRRRSVLWRRGPACRQRVRIIGQIPATVTFDLRRVRPPAIPHSSQRYFTPACPRTPGPDPASAPGFRPIIGGGKAETLGLFLFWPFGP